MCDFTMVTSSSGDVTLSDITSTSEVEAEFKLLVKTEVAVAHQVEAVDLSTVLLW